MSKQLSVWSATFSGHYPVGASAIVLAATPEKAIELLHIALIEEGLDQEVDLGNLKYIDTWPPRAVIIDNGEY